MDPERSQCSCNGPPAAGSWVARRTHTGSAVRGPLSSGTPPGRNAQKRQRPWGVGGRPLCLAGPCPGIYLEILDVFGAAELRQAGGPHQGEEVKEQRPVAPQDGIGSLTVATEPWGRWGGSRGRGEAGLWVLTAVPTLLSPWKQPPLPLSPDTPASSYRTRPCTRPAWDPEHPYLSNFSLLFVFPCWITCTKSYVRMNGTRSRLIPNLVLKFPRKWPKSMWNS